MESGALDAFITPIIMKKGRPANKLTVLSYENTCSILEDIIFNETKTLGLRKYKTDRIIQNRKTEIINIPDLGEVRIKYNLNKNGEILSAKPEYEDCKKLAVETNQPLINIMTKISKVIQKT